MQLKAQMILSTTNREHQRKSHSKRRRRKVTFSDEVVVSIKEIKYRDRMEAWYTKEELEMIREGVKVQSKIYRTAVKNSTSDLSSQSSLVLPFLGCAVEENMKLLTKSTDHSSSLESTFRGLESRIFIEMQRNRIIAMKTILEYQRRSRELLQVAKESQNMSCLEMGKMKESFTERLACISRQLSLWSTQAALAIARYDASGVFEIISSSHDHYDPCLKSPSQVVNRIPISATQNFVPVSLVERSINLNDCKANSLITTRKALDALKRKRSPMSHDVNYSFHTSSYLSEPIFTKE
uniref:Uncharacterized protein n=1 Tax=Chaetoceros debilis TaxID=122233 RepID=A0A7S3PYU8_9STRA|mmetsp:Transcript_26280/g.40168  ORF Transcript_26280/g.40168 Transcript_26280/m.40168 type:complete len:295 (+) Transcript_26280:128-1012(+)